MLVIYLQVEVTPARKLSFYLKKDDKTLLFLSTTQGLHGSRDFPSTPRAFSIGAYRWSYLR